MSFKEYYMSIPLKIEALASLAGESKILVFFLTFRKKMGRSGDEKRNILMEWPPYY